MMQADSHKNHKIASPIVRIVDDDASVREALTVYLQMADYGTVAYPSAAQFLEEDDHARPGCLVLDVRMPDMNGIELQGEMKRRGIELPVIFLSAHGDIEMAADAVRAGAKGFLVKPPKLEKLTALIDESLIESQETMRGHAYGATLDEAWKTLTAAEEQVAMMVAKGLTNAVVAQALGITERTVRAHREAIYRKLDVENAVELADFLRDREAYGVAL